MAAEELTAAGEGCRAGGSSGDPRRLRRLQQRPVASRSSGEGRRRRVRGAQAAGGGGTAAAEACEVQQQGKVWASRAWRGHGPGVAGVGERAWYGDGDHGVHGEGRPRAPRARACWCGSEHELRRSATAAASNRGGPDDGEGELHGVVGDAAKCGSDSLQGGELSMRRKKGCARERVTGVHKRCSRKCQREEEAD